MIKNSRLIRAEDREKGQQRTESLEAVESYQMPQLICKPAKVREQPRKWTARGEA
jgi:hypothetical protein